MKYDIDRILLEPPKSSVFYHKMKFSQKQLQALTYVYKKYWEPYMPPNYNGGAVFVCWAPGAKWEQERYQGDQANVRGIVQEEAIYDPIWKMHFEDILPYMSAHGNISRMPAGAIMNPHVDRQDRPPAIYFPIEGCSEHCYTDFYDLPQSTSLSRQNPFHDAQPIYSIPVNSNAVLYNVHEWHGVRNLSNQTRVAFGWNTRSSNLKTYDEIVLIFKNLGYIEND